MDEKGEPWFVAKDICEVLGFGNYRQALDSHVDTEDVQKLDTLTSGGMQAMSALNESGLYSLIMGSKLEGAKRFKRWVTSEVLPSIRKTALYAA
jgi:prophage antirepressor-like protein